MSVILRLGSIAIFSTVLTMAATTAVKAQTPAMHWGSDSRPISVAECVRRAQEIIGVKGFRVTVSGSSVQGAGPSVAVLVDYAAIPAGVHILVVGASPDSTLAERTRNEVRIAVMR